VHAVDLIAHIPVKNTLLKCLHHFYLLWMIAKEETAPMPWTISRRDEIDAYLMTRDYGPYAMIAVLPGPSFWYNRIRRKKVDYVGSAPRFFSLEHPISLSLSLSVSISLYLFVCPSPPSKK